MQSHGPKRIYTPQSLEFWFGRMEIEWEGQFDATHVERGHSMYRDNEIREVELGARDAIIHRRVDKKEEYAVIEWDGDAIKVRSSSTDDLLANAIAVAGLHEIEELLVDEMPALLPGGTTRAGKNGHNSQATNGNGTNGHTQTGNGNGHGNGHGAAVAAPPAGPAGAPGAVRDLLLSFTANADGLVFLAYWKNGRNRIPALGNATHHPTPTERAKLIALATYARKAHFRYNQVTHAYALDALADIPGFLRDLLPHWKKQFAIELDAKVDNIKQGARTIEIEAVADKRAGASGGLNLRWIFRAGEKLLTDEQAAALLKHGRTPMLLPDLGIVTMAPEKWESYQHWKRSLEETQVGGEVPPYLIFSLFNDKRIKVSLGPEIEAWRTKVLTPPATPPVLPDYLRNYQRRGVEWMHHLCETDCHGLLADEMGLGKTAQVIALLRARPMGRHRHIVVCPASVVPVWREEIARFHPEAVVEVLKSGHDFKQHKSYCIWLASYTQLRKHRALLDQTDFGYAILDEGQFIKNPDAKVTQACFALRAEHRLVMTGTPLENRQLDLWSIFRYLLPGLLGTRAGFESALIQDRDGTMNRLRQQVAPFILRRTKTEVATELPPKVEMDLLCPLTEVQRAEYGRICTEGLARLGEDISVALREKSFGFLALLTRLRQVCCDPDLLPWLNSPLTDSGKLQLLIEKLQEVVASGHKVVIFSQFVTLLDRVRSALVTHYPDLPRYEITGMTVDRQKPVKDFQSATGAAAMLVSLKAAGTGITLHAADYVFLLDPWWNPAVEDQAIDRVHRIGQKSTVFVYRMVTAGTIEERIQALKSEKKQLFNQVVGGHSGDFEWTKHFSSLHSLIELSAAATEAETYGPAAPAVVLEAAAAVPTTVSRRPRWRPRCRRRPVRRGEGVGAGFHTGAVVDVEIDDHLPRNKPLQEGRAAVRSGRVKQVVPQIYRRLLRLLRWRLWVAEKLRPSPWQETLAYAAVAGVLGALAALVFRNGIEVIHHVLTGTGLGMVDSFRELEWWQRLFIPAVGGLMAGLVLLFGKRLHKGQSSTDYMEAILIGSGEIPVRATLVKSTAAMFSIASGGSIGREGPMVQLAAVASSWLGRWRKLSAPQLRLLVACGGASGIASAYNAPIAGSFFVAEIILGTIAMESLGPLAVSAVAATLTMRTLSDAHTLYQVPAFTLYSLWEIGPFVLLGALAGLVAPWFLRSLRSAERLFAATSLPVPVRLALGGLVVGTLAVWVPEVCGNGYSVVVGILNGHFVWEALLLVLVCKWVATAASFGSGAPGGVFTPTLFVGATLGYLFGFGVHAVWPAGAADPRAFALVGMGALLAAASHAPVMAIIMLFEMTLSYDIIMPLMLCSVVAYYTARGIENNSLYSEALKKKAAEAPAPVALPGIVADLQRPVAAVALTDHFEGIARRFLETRHEEIHVTDPEGRYAGAISLHDIKPHLNDEAVATLVIAEDLRRDDVPTVAPEATLGDALHVFAQHSGQTLPVVEGGTGRLTGILVKNDLLLALLEGRGAEKRGGGTQPPFRR